MGDSLPFSDVEGNHRTACGRPDVQRAPHVRPALQLPSQVLWTWKFMGVWATKTPTTEATLQTRWATICRLWTWKGRLGLQLST